MRAPRGAALDARMSRSSPGRYAVHEFAKNAFDVRASDGTGTPLRVSPSQPVRAPRRIRRGVANEVINGTGRRFRSAVEMSQ